jgi:proteasome lid subunit RPN8/RPN11
MPGGWRVSLSPEARRTIQASARATLPEEAVGFLVGARDPESCRYWVEAAVAGRNSAEGDRSISFCLQPSTVRAFERDLAPTGPSLIGFFHSHPEGGSRPSGEDLDLAWPQYLYVVAGLDSSGNWSLTCYPESMEIENSLPDSMVPGGLSEPPGGA